MKLDTNMRNFIKTYLQFMGLWTLAVILSALILYPLLTFEKAIMFIQIGAGISVLLAILSILKDKDLQ